MKKLLSVILALSMVLAIGITAFADEADYGQATGVLEAGKAYSYSVENENIDVSKGVILSDANGILSFGEPIVLDGKIVFKVNVPAGALGMVTKIVVKANDKDETELYNQVVSIVRAESAGSSSGNSSAAFESGKTYALTFDVSTKDGIVIYDTNELLNFSNPVMLENKLAINVTPVPTTGQKVTKIVVTANDKNKTLLHEMFVTVEGTTATVTPEPSTPTTPPATTTPTQKPNAETGATNSAAAMVAIAVMGAAALVTKKIAK